MGAEHEVERLRERERALTNFVALAAHELRAPATVVHGIAATMRARPDELAGPNGRTLVDLLHVQSERLVRLVEQLLDLSRLDGGGVVIQRQRVSLRERMEQLVETVAGERAGDVAVVVAPELDADVDPHALDRIVGNLVTNALRHGAAPVRIAAEQVDGDLRLVVDDHGPGVPAELRDDLFERFSRHGDGTGLGLAIADSYARAHGGVILYEPRSPGARFRLVLPAAAPREIPA